MTGERSEAELHGQLITDLPLEVVYHALRRAGVDAHYHVSPHGDADVRVSGSGDADFLMERGKPGEYLVCDAGGERGALEELARVLSDVLAALGIRHRLELYDEGGSEAFAYLHHGWPLS